MKTKNITLKDCSSFVLFLLAMFFLFSCSKSNNAVYWKNSTPYYLTDGTKEAMVKDMVFFGDNIYITGYEKADQSPGSSKIAKYWINDAAHAIALSDETNKGEGSYIFVTEE